MRIRGDAILMTSVGLFASPGGKGPPEELGIIHEGGKVLLEATHKELRAFSTELVKVRDDDAWGIYDAGEWGGLARSK